jgi:hypothetical protein
MDFEYPVYVMAVVWMGLDVNHVVITMACESFLKDSVTATPTLMQDLTQNTSLILRKCMMSYVHQPPSCFML